MTLEELKYPIGKTELPDAIDQNDIRIWIKTLAEFPNRLETLVKGLNEDQLDTPYRDGGWTIRQVVHHLVDSHTNSYIRFKWTLTEDEPVIKAYYEDRWAELTDSRNAPIEMSLRALDALHQKWVYLLKHLDGSQLKRCFIHPESNKKVSLEQNIGIYAWHSEHHYAHIANLLRRMNWV